MATPPCLPLRGPGLASDATTRARDEARSPSGGDQRTPARFLQEYHGLGGDGILHDLLLGQRLR
eukprot:3680484-Lingulodinium_polyedra.AAC.1